MQHNPSGPSKQHKTHSEETDDKAEDRQGRPVRHPAMKRSGSILSTRSPQGAQAPEPIRGTTT